MSWWVDLIEGGVKLVQRLRKKRKNPGPDVQPIELTKVKKPGCPKCSSGYVVAQTRQDGPGGWACCSCGHEWAGEPS